MGIEKIVSRAGQRAVCDICGEEIMNEREIVEGSTIACRACAGQAYYQLVMPLALAAIGLTAEA